MSKDVYGVVDSFISDRAMHLRHTPSELPSGRSHVIIRIIAKSRNRTTLIDSRLCFFWKSHQRKDQWLACLTSQRHSHLLSRQAKKPEHVLGDFILAMK